MKTSTQKPNQRRGDLRMRQLKGVQDSGRKERPIMPMRPSLSSRSLTQSYCCDDEEGKARRRKGSCTLPWNQRRT